MPAGCLYLSFSRYIELTVFYACFQNDDAKSEKTQKQIKLERTVFSPSFRQDDLFLFFFMLFNFFFITFAYLNSVVLWGFRHLEKKSGGGEQMGD